MGRKRPPALWVVPVTPDRWKDLETLFGERGAYGGCWCMWWRISRAEFSRNGNRGNRRGLKALVDDRTVPGLLAYTRRGEPVAWVSVGPRETFPALERSRTLRRIDDRPVWSVVCFVVAKPYRDRGLMTPLLRAAVAYAKKRGAQVVEGYPVTPDGRLTGYDGFTGVVSTFRRAGFVEEARPTRRTRIMRYYIRDARPAAGADAPPPLIGGDALSLRGAETRSILGFGTINDGFCEPNARETTI